MNTVTPVYQLESENKSWVNLSSRNMVKKAGRYGMAMSAISAALCAPSAHVIVVNEVSTITPSLKVTTGISTSKTSKSTQMEIETNQYAFKGFNSSNNEYLKSRYITLNGSLLEANNEVERDIDNFEVLYDEDMVSDLSFEPLAKRTFKLQGELTIVKSAKPDHQYMAGDFLQDEISFEPTPKRTFKL